MIRRSKRSCVSFIVFVGNGSIGLQLVQPISRRKSPLNQYLVAESCFVRGQHSCLQEEQPWWARLLHHHLLMLNRRILYNRKMAGDGVLSVKGSSMVELGMECVLLVERTMGQLARIICCYSNLTHYSCTFLKRQEGIPHGKAQLIRAFPCEIGG